MTDNNAKFAATKTNEVTRINESSNNPWVVGISKSHPGQKYFFNTVTGVSLWHISSEEIERSLPHLRPNGSQCQYVNCPEPKEPPPNRTSLIKHCQHTVQCPKIDSRDVANVFPRQSSRITSEVCCSSTNQLALNYRHQVGNLECTLQLNNTPQSQVASTECPSLNILPPESTFGCSKTKHLLERKTCCSDEDPDISVQDPKCHENMVDETNNDGQCLDKTSTHLEMVDVSPLKVLAKNGCIDDKWYIVADVSVYLHSIQFLRTVLNSDQQCCLMVPQYVKVELENATKTHQKTKAYCANYFLHKLLDDDVAVMDGDPNSQLNEKFDKENLINCCLKLANQNFFVILISNDMQLKKYRHKLNIPVFTVKELKDYLCRNSYKMASPSPESSLVVPQCKKIKEITPCATTSGISELNDTTVLNKYSATAVKQCQNIQTPLNLNISNEQFGSKHVTLRTVETGVQTDLSLTELEKMENVYKKTNLCVQNDDKVKDKETMLSQSFGSLLSTSNQSRKPIKLRRRKIINQPVSADPVILSETQNNPNTVDIFSSNDNLLLSKELAEVNQNSQNTLLTSMGQRNKTYVGDKNKNTTNCFVEPLLHDSVQNQSNNNNKIVNKSFEKANVEGPDDFKLKKPFNAQNENVMFEVTSVKMEKNLKAKSNEWILRFMQIMEEASSKVLSKPSSSHVSWNIYEAIVCIRQKYEHDADVSNASIKLINVLNNISDDKGISNVKLSPRKFMELYSYGQYYIDALQGVLNDCEDLQIDDGSLAKLLNDIQNADLDLSDNESFHDMSQEDHVRNNNEYSSNEIETVVGTENNSCIRQTVNTENLPEDDIDEMGQTNNPIIPSYENVSPKNITKRLENLSNPAEELNKSIPTKNYAIENQLTSVNMQGTFNTNTVTEKSTRCPNNESVTSRNSNILKYLKLKKTITTQEQENLDKAHLQQSCQKSSFLSNLLLQDNRDLPRNSVCKNMSNNEVSNNDQPSHNIESNEKVNKDVSNEKAKINTSSNEPKIIRNFVVCSEFEDRLRNNQIQDEFDDYEFDGEEMEVDYNDVDDFSRNKSKVDVADFTEFHNNIYHPVGQDVHYNKDVVKIYFTCFIKRIAEEIRDLSRTVYNFRLQEFILDSVPYAYYKWIRNGRLQNKFLNTNYCDGITSEATPIDKNDVREKAAQTHLYIDKVCMALTSILRRDKDFNYNLKAVLNRTEFDTFIVDEDQMDVYGVFIVNCLKQACDLKKIMEDILSSAQE